MSFMFDYMGLLHGISEKRWGGREFCVCVIEERKLLCSCFW